MKSKFLAILAVAAFACVSVLAGCTTGQVQPIPPAQIAAVACPQLNLVHTQLVAFNTALEASPSTAATGQKAAAQLAAIQPVVAAVCNGAAAVPNVDFSNIQTLAQTGFPALAAIAASLPLAPAQQAQIQAALAVAETAAGVCERAAADSTRRGDVDEVNREMGKRKRKADYTPEEWAALLAKHRASQKTYYARNKERIAERRPRRSERRTILSPNGKSFLRRKPPRTAHTIWRTGMQCSHGLDLGLPQSSLHVHLSRKFQGLLPKSVIAAGVKNIEMR